MNIDGTESKNLFTTKTFWAAILAPVVAWVGGHVFHAQPDTINVMTEALATVAPVFIGLRLKTDQPAHIVPPQSPQQAARNGGMPNDEVSAHRIQALETAVAEHRALLTSGLERIHNKLDALIEIKVRADQTEKDLGAAWSAIRHHDELIGSLRELPGMKVTLFGQDGQGGLVARANLVEGAARALETKITVAVESNDDRLDAIERELEGAGEESGLIKRVTKLEEEGRIYSRTLKVGGAAMMALVVWVMTNIGDKLKALFFHGP